jgi:hypothetical protein
MDEDTGWLLLRRALGRACPEDYVSWAVERLCQNDDTPALRILAGLNSRFDRGDIEHYFVLTCRELDSVDIDSCSSPLKTSQVIRRAYDRGLIAAAETVDMMAEVYESSGSDEELLAPWYNLREALAWGEDYYYPVSELTSLDQAVRREFSLLDRALALAPPRGWMSLTLCMDCRHVGRAFIQEPSRLLVLWATFRRRHAFSTAACERCRSTKISRLDHPDARSTYLDQFETRGG